MKDWISPEKYQANHIPPEDKRVNDDDDDDDDNDSNDAYDDDGDYDDHNNYDEGDDEDDVCCVGQVKHSIVLKAADSVIIWCLGKS